MSVHVYVMYIKCIHTNPNSSVPEKPVQISEFVFSSEPLSIMQSLVNYSNRTYTFDKILL